MGRLDKKDEHLVSLRFRSVMDIIDYNIPPCPQVGLHGSRHDQTFWSLHGEQDTPVILLQRHLFPHTGME